MAEKLNLNDYQQINRVPGQPGVLEGMPKDGSQPIQFKEETVLTTMRHNKKEREFYNQGAADMGQEIPQDTWPEAEDTLEKTRTAVWHTLYDGDRTITVNGEGSAMADGRETWKTSEWGDVPKDEVDFVSEKTETNADTPEVKSLKEENKALKEQVKSLEERIKALEEMLSNRNKYPIGAVVTVLMDGQLQEGWKVVVDAFPEDDGKTYVMVKPPEGQPGANQKVLLEDLEKWNQEETSSEDLKIGEKLLDGSGKEYGVKRLYKEAGQDMVELETIVEPKETINKSLSELLADLTFGQMKRAEKDDDYEYEWEPEEGDQVFVKTGDGQLEEDWTIVRIFEEDGIKKITAKKQAEGEPQEVTQSYDTFLQWQVEAGNFDEEEPQDEHFKKGQKVRAFSRYRLKFEDDWVVDDIYEKNGTKYVRLTKNGFTGLKNKFRGEPKVLVLEVPYDRLLAWNQGGSSQEAEAGPEERDKSTTKLTKWDRVKFYANPMNIPFWLGRKRGKVVEEEVVQTVEKDRRRGCLGAALGAFAVGAVVGAAAWELLEHYLEGKHGIPKTGIPGKIREHIDTSSIAPDTIHAKSPVEFQNGVLDLLERQGIHASGVTPEKLEHMNQWMSNHDVASGMKMTPHGLEQNLVDFPDSGVQFPNAAASADQGFPIGSDGSGKQALRDWIREAENAGITFTRG